MGGYLAICNETTIPAEFILTGLQGRTKLSRTCEPWAICAFDNIRPVEYLVEVKMDNKLVLQTKCKAKGCLYTLSETFQLECDEDSRILIIKKKAPLGIKFEGAKITGLCYKREVQGLAVGWRITQIGHIRLNSWDFDSIEQEGESDTILNLIDEKFGGKNVVLVFSKTRRESELISVELGDTTAKTGSSNDKSKVAWRKGMGIKLRSLSPKMRLPKLTWFKSSPQKRNIKDFGFSRMKEWYLLNEAHKEMIEKDNESTRSLVLKLANIFENTLKTAEAEDKGTHMVLKDHAQSSMLQAISLRESGGRLFDEESLFE